MVDAVIRLRKRIIVVYFAAFLCSGVTVGSVGPTMINLSRRTGQSVGAMGALISAFSIGQFIAALLSGNLLETVGGNTQVALSLFICACGCLLLPLMRSFVGVLACFVCFGVTMGVLDTAANVMLIYMFDKEVAPWMQAAHCLFGVGALIAPPLVPHLTPNRLCLT